MCKLLEVGKSSYYDWRKKGGKSVNEKWTEVKRLIESIYFWSKQRYGSPRIHKELINRGIQVSKPTVAKLMQELGLQSKIGKKFKKTTNSNHKLPVAPNLLDRNFTSSHPDKKWGSDISYLPVQEGFIFLTVILDLYDRKIVGWSLSEGLDTKSTIITAWNNCHRKLDSGGIFHSDRGVQHASKCFSKLLKNNKIRQSMSKKGDCWDNAVVESFFKTIKAELIYGTKPMKTQEIKSLIFEYIEIWYNQQRRHSTLGLLTIPEFYQTQ